jgi:hypothetical protein
MTSCLKTTEHRLWTMRIEAYYKLSKANRVGCGTAVAQRIAAEQGMRRAVSRRPLSRSLVRVALGGPTFP